MQQIAKTVFFNINQIEKSRWLHAAVAKSGEMCGLSFFFPRCNEKNQIKKLPKRINQL